MQKKYLFIVILSTVTCFSQAQNADTVSVDALLITSKTILDRNNTIQVKRNSSVVDLLIKQSTLFLKTNAPGSSVTTSLAGGNASHTTVSINDFPIINPLIGQVDFSLLPSFALQSLVIDQTHTTAIAGNIDLQTLTNLDTIPSIQVAFNTKSYNYAEVIANYKQRLGKIATTLSFNKTSTANNYKFKIPELGYVTRQTHAQQDITQALLTADYQLSPKVTLKALYWWHDQSRQLPPTITQSSSGQEQEDSFHKIGLTYNQATATGFIKAAYCFTTQNLIFRDRQLESQNAAHFTTQYFKTTYVPKLYSKMNTEFSYMLDHVETDNPPYGAKQTQTIHKLNSKVSRRSNTLFVQATADLIYSPFLNQSTNWAANLFSKIMLKHAGSINLAVARVWRAPAMNDLFWRPGGNLNLKPEQGITTKAGYQSHRGKTLLMEANIFSRWITDYILWFPAGSSFMWRANNVDLMWSRGLDWQLSWQREINNLLIGFQTYHQLAYTSSTTDVTAIGLQKDKQIIYTPTYTHKTILELQFVGFRGEFSTRYTSKYLGINADLPATTVFGLELSKRMLFNKSSLDISMAIDNLLDLEYQIVERRPMPGRNATFHLTYTFH